MTYLGKKRLSKIISSIISKKTFEEREKVNSFFDITNGDERAEWAIVGVNELENRVVNSCEEEEMVNKIINFLQSEIWI